MPAINTVYECTACHWLGLGDEIRTELIHLETILEPAEYEWYCPDCNRSDTLEPFEGVTCRSCERVPVKDENDLCGECYTAAQEVIHDRLRGH